ncbi:hypothetical protein ACIGHB_29695 [Streptomyces sp. NPDC085460]|uniref:hypothetical protein n=1 Tax=Streptomyces sp. NPDC085460 TaxID=3365723 RepID=UPI0037D09CFE
MPTHDTPSAVELYPPTDEDGWYASQVRDWVAVCPELGDPAVRLYLILRSLVIDKHGPVRKLSIAELCHLLPRKAVAPGERPEPSSVSRIRGLLDQLTRVGLVTTPEGRRLTSSSRALAAGQQLRMRINLMPRRSYAGPRNAFDVLDEIRPAAERSARAARERELDLARARRAARQEEGGKGAQTGAAGAGQNSGPQGAGQNSGPRGQNFDPRGQNSDPDSGDDLQDRDLPLSLTAQSYRSDTDTSSVRPSPQVVVGWEGAKGGTDERMDEGPDRVQEGNRPQAGRAGEGQRQDEVPMQRPEMTAGLDILYRLGAQVPVLALAGRPLADQARRLDTLLACTSWTAELLLAALAAPFEGPVRTSAGAVVSARITALPAAPAFEYVPDPDGAGRGVAQERQRRVMAECTECGRPPEAGSDLCAECAGWQLCPSCHFYRTPDGAPCRHCTDTAVVTAAEPTARCAGHDGAGCGTPVLKTGSLVPLCGRCQVQAHRIRAARDAQWADAVRAAVAAAAADTTL